MRGPRLVLALSAAAIVALLVAVVLAGTGGDSPAETSVGDAYTADEQEQLFRHLRALGYVE